MTVRYEWEKRVTDKTFASLAARLEAKGLRLVGVAVAHDISGEAALIAREWPKSGSVSEHDQWHDIECDAKKIHRAAAEASKRAYLSKTRKR